MYDKRATPFIVLDDNGTYEDYERALAAYKREVVNKWRWYLEGKLPDGTDLGLEPIREELWETMAILFENQQAVSNRPVLEQTTKSDVTLPVRFALPIVRQVYPELIVTRIASVQPLPIMSGGVGQIFYQDFLREDKGAGDESTSELDSDYALSSENAIPKRVKMTITADTIEAEKHILAATWSTEVEEDVRGALGLDVHQELINAAAREILQELDYMMISEIMAGASAGNVNWKWTPDTGYTTKEWYETLYHALIDAEDLIFGKRYRNADYLVCGRSVSKYLRKAGSFEPANVGDFRRFTTGMRYEGNLEGLWDVYTTVFMDTNQGLMGVYPRGVLDTGYVFAPYIPLTPMPLVYADFDPATGSYENKDKWTRNIRTRNAHKMVVGDMFATLQIAAS
jgi:hypothetical protein